MASELIDPFDDPNFQPGGTATMPPSPARSGFVDRFDDPNYQIGDVLLFQHPAIEAAPFPPSEVAREALGAVRDVATEGLLILTAVLVTAAYGRTAGGMARAVIHRAGATMIGIVGFGFALFLVVLFVMDLMDGKQHVTNISTFIGGIAAATCLALTVWNVLCGIGGAWRNRWAIIGIVLGVLAGAAGYADRSVRTAAATAAATSPPEHAQFAQIQLHPSLTEKDDVAVHVPGRGTIHFPAETPIAAVKRSVVGMMNATEIELEGTAPDGTTYVIVDSFIPGKGTTFQFPVGTRRNVIDSVIASSSAQ
jgi:hypothetical protein